MPLSAQVQSCSYVFICCITEYDASADIANPTEEQPLTQSQPRIWFDDGKISNEKYLSDIDQNDNIGDDEEDIIIIPSLPVEQDQQDDEDGQGIVFIQDDHYPTANLINPYGRTNTDDIHLAGYAADPMAGKNQCIECTR